MEPLKAPKGVVGPAIIIVPLSESIVDRWLFNDYVEFAMIEVTKENFVKTALDAAELTSWIRADDVLPEPVKKNRGVFKAFNRTLWNRRARSIKRG